MKTRGSSSSPASRIPLQRLRAVRQLVDAGLDCGVLMAPIVPGFSTQPSKIERTIKAIADSGARSVGAMVMHLQGGTRDHFMALLAREYPHLVDRYEHLYAGKYARKDYTKQVDEVVSMMRARYLRTTSRAGPPGRDGDRGVRERAEQSRS